MQNVDGAVLEPLAIDAFQCQSGTFAEQHHQIVEAIVSVESKSLHIQTFGVMRLEEGFFLGVFGQAPHGAAAARTLSFEDHTLAISTFLDLKVFFVRVFLDHNSVAGTCPDQSVFDGKEVIGLAFLARDIEDLWSRSATGTCFRFRCSVKRGPKNSQEDNQNKNS